MPKEIKSDLIEDKTIKLLNKFQILKKLTENEIRLLLGIEKSDRYQKRIAKLIKYYPQEVIIQQDEFDCWVYWVVKGSFIVLKDKTAIAVFNQPGEVFGEMSLVEDKNRRTATVISAEKSVCLRIDMSVLDNLVDKSVKEKIKTGIDRLKTERLTKTSHNLINEKRKIDRQKKELELKMKNLKEKEAELKQMEVELLEKENALASWEERLAEQEAKMNNKSG